MVNAPASSVASACSASRRRAASPRSRSPRGVLRTTAEGAEVTDASTDPIPAASRRVTGTRAGSIVARWYRCPDRSPSWVGSVVVTIQPAPVQGGLGHGIRREDDEGGVDAGRGPSRSEVGGRARDPAATARRGSSAAGDGRAPRRSAPRRPSRASHPRPPGSASASSMPAYRRAVRVGKTRCRPSRTTRQPASMRWPIAAPASGCVRSSSARPTTVSMSSALAVDPYDDNPAHPIAHPLIAWTPATSWAGPGPAFPTQNRRDRASAAAQPRRPVSLQRRVIVRAARRLVRELALLADAPQPSRDPSRGVSPRSTRTTRRSVTIAVISSAGVTSNAGLRVRVPAGAVRTPPNAVSSSEGRSSMMIAVPSGVPGRPWTRARSPAAECRHGVRPGPARSCRPCWRCPRWP